MYVLRSQMRVVQPAHVDRVLWVRQPGKLQAPIFAFLQQTWHIFGTSGHFSETLEALWTSACKLPGGQNVHLKLSVIINRHTLLKCVLYNHSPKLSWTESKLYALVLNGVMLRENCSFFSLLAFGMTFILLLFFFNMLFLYSPGIFLSLFAPCYLIWFAHVLFHSLPFSQVFSCIMFHIQSI